MFKLYIN